MIEKSFFKNRIFSLICLFTCSVLFLTSCGSKHGVTLLDRAGHKKDAQIDETVRGSRDNTPLCLVPTAPGTDTFENEYARIDYSNMSEGYIFVAYKGSSPKVKLQITGPDTVTYTYDISNNSKEGEVFPLQAGNGQYMINVYENITETKYSMVFTFPIDVTLSNGYKPFLYPNQFINFAPDSLAVRKGAALAYPCNSDIEVVAEVYNFMIENITYDYEEAETVQSGYLPDLDEILITQKGICLDYASLMAAMLRSQNIPTKMEVGYAGTAYHAWLSTYIKDVGWVNGMIEFDGKDWSLLDPTFASNTEERKLENFIGDGSNYSVKYVY
ncbi:transglutaminase-like domain-containing protein [Butyrivibrio sp. M55]|uniref:transglutaminase-like domain-containing protein n=1 Tax=Butyrivibrio sp. M55 TaxID=1855323 RepID=UPI001FA8BAF2|nr:transglutaminase-like domain-containing protein [Butyrivibrio sp. M55]